MESQKLQVGARAEQARTDEETAREVMEAAAKGHQVWTTLNSYGTLVESIARIQALQPAGR